MNSTKPDYVPPMGQLLAHQHPLITISLGLAAILLISKIFRPAKPTSARRTPPMLSETIPYITNTYQFIMKMDKFMVRAAKALTHRTIIGFHLGPFGKRVYLVKSDANVTTLIKNSPSIGFEFLLLLGLENMMGFTPQDLAKFAGDKSGRLMSAPLPGTEHIPKEERYYARLHEVMHKYLANAYFANELGVRYQGYLEEWLLSAYADQQQLGGQGQGDGGEGNDGWVEIPTGIVRFMKHHMARASTQSLMGTRLLQLVPDLLERFWAYDEIVGTLVLGPKPKWLFRDVYGKGDRFIEAMGKYFELADREFVWDDEEALQADWEEVFGSRFCRELVSFGKRSGLSLRSMGGMIGSVAMVALNANAIYVTIWGVMELAKDTELSRLIREEVETTFVTDQTTGLRRIDIQKLIVLPRLQSLYLELMRTHVSMNVMREVMTPDFQLDGYHLPKGSLLAACTDIIHNDDGIWGAENHPATEFWAERHLRYVDADEIDVQTGRKKQVPRFQMARPTEFLSYGGGVSMCPGRHFAKQEIMLTLAYFASRFEIECVEWLNMDGTKSDREARNDPKYTGAAGVPPDRDMKVRWRRIW